MQSPLEIYNFLLELLRTSPKRSLNTSCQGLPLVPQTSYTYSLVHHHKGKKDTKMFFRTASIAALAIAAVPARADSVAPIGPIVTPSTTAAVTSAAATTDAPAAGSTGTITDTVIVTDTHCPRCSHTTSYSNVTFSSILTGSGHKPSATVPYVLATGYVRPSNATRPGTGGISSGSKNGTTTTGGIGGGSGSKNGTTTGGAGGIGGGSGSGSGSGPSTGSGSTSSGSSSSGSTSSGAGGIGGSGSLSGSSSSGSSSGVSPTSSAALSSPANKLLSPEFGYMSAIALSAVWGAFMVLA
ncbi:hypothetical protein DTO195F2_4960 [Paecilomyces variotii]|nr:hypothetical protein DTO195F2_4960 [Paecilomyces variotii]KAJ9362445.1 hypothetical protein DTO027B9_122 [Paecilomyces variotii]